MKKPRPLPKLVIKIAPKKRKNRKRRNAKRK